MSNLLTDLKATININLIILLGSLKLAFKEFKTSISGFSSQVFYNLFMI